MGCELPEWPEVAWVSARRRGRRALRASDSICSLCRPRTTTTTPSGAARALVKTVRQFGNVAVREDGQNGLRPGRMTQLFRHQVGSKHGRLGLNNARQRCRSIWESAHVSKRSTTDSWSRSRRAIFAAAASRLSRDR